MIMKTSWLASVLFVFALLNLGVAPAFAEGQGIVATVNDRPITTFDIDQRIKLLKIMGARGDTVSKKQSFQSLVDDYIKQTEAKKLQIQATDKMVDEQLGRMAKNFQTDAQGLAVKFKKQGVSLSALRSYVESQISFQRLYRFKNPEKEIKADPALIDKEYKTVLAKYNSAVTDMKQRYAKAENDPRRRPVLVYQIQQIDFPIQLTNGAMDQGLITSRAVEVNLFLSRYRGCKGAKAAGDGIFNVRVGKTLEADASKLPKQLKAALDKAGTGRAIGPVMGKGALQAIGFCSKRTISPPKLPPMPKAPPPPARKDFEGRALNIAFADEEERFMATLRGKAIIEYKDPSYSQ